MPKDHVSIDYLVDRLFKYCAAKDDIAVGVVRPGTDDYGNWTNSGDEFSGRLEAQVFRHLLSGAKQGEINICYWRCDTNYLYRIPPADWASRGKDTNGFSMRMKMPPDKNRLQRDGIEPIDFSAELIVFRDEAEAFLNRHAPRPFAGLSGGLRNINQLNAEKQASNLFQSLGAQGTPGTPKTKRDCINEAKKLYGGLSNKAAERAWQNGAHSSRRKPGRKITTCE